MPVELVYLESQPSRADAMRREAAIKRWPRIRKLALAHPSPARKRRRS